MPKKRTNYSKRLDEKYGAGASPLVHNKGASNEYGNTVYSRPKPKASTTPKPKTVSKRKKAPSKKAKVYSGRGEGGMPKSAPLKTGPTSHPRNKPSAKVGPSVMSSSPSQPSHRPSFSITAPESKTTASKTVRHTPRRPRAGWHTGGKKPKMPLVGQQFRTPR